MTQSQRWGKVVTTMAVPEGDITTSEILETESVVEETIEEGVLNEEELDQA
jgi:hypothetical protein